MKPFLFLLGLFFCLGINAKENTITLSNGEWQPFLGEQLEHHGTVTQLVTEAFALIGYTSQYEFMPWKRALMTASNCEVDGTIAWAKTEDRSRTFAFSDPIMKTRHVLFSLDTPLSWTTLEDLKTIKIGAGISYFYGDAFKQAEDSGLITVERSVDDLTNFRKLLAGRIDAVIIEQSVGEWIIANQLPSDAQRRITVSAQSIHTSENHLLLCLNKPGNIELIEQFNNALKELRRTGRMAEILGAATP